MRDCKELIDDLRYKVKIFDLCGDHSQVRDLMEEAADMIESLMDRVPFISSNVKEETNDICS